MDTEEKHEGRITMLEQRDQMIMEALSELRGKTDLILVQVTKVAVLEANHTHQGESLARAFTRLESLERAHAEFVKQTLEFTASIRGMAKMAYWLWGLMGSSVVLMLMKILFGGGH